MHDVAANIASTFHTTPLERRYTLARTSKGYPALSHWDDAGGDSCQRWIVLLGRSKKFLS
jgi:hypothetical protein